MGHIAAKTEYLDLQKRLDRNPLGAPANSTFFSLLEELFTPDECRVAAAMPMKLSPTRIIAEKAGMDEKRAGDILAGLVGKGLVVDFTRSDGRTFYFLNPPIVGFFEFTMMRVRTEIDQKKVAKLMWEYIHEDPDRAFMKMFTEGQTFIGRPLVHEDMLAPDVFSEVLDWEKATDIVENAGSWSVGICYCRHMKHHLGDPCRFPMDNCLSLGKGADYLTHAGIARRIERAEAMDIMTRSRESGLVQMGDNVRNHPTFICNCCKCCCEMMEGLRSFPDITKVVSSNYVAGSSADDCNGCGKCAKVCPVNAVEMIDAQGTAKTPKRKKRAVVNRDLCLGCGVCVRECKYDGMSLAPLSARVYTPETMMEKIMLQALERGKLQNMLFDNPDRVTHRALNAFIGALVNLPPAKRLLAREQVKSKLVHTLLDGLAKSKQGWMAKV